MKNYLLVLCTFVLVSTSYSQIGRGGRMNEIFKITNVVNSGAGSLQDPWEITYGPDDSLWITEAKGYKVRKFHPVTNGSRLILDLLPDGGFVPSNYRKTFTGNQPQGGLMGLAIHPDFMTATNKYVYLAYVRDFIGLNKTNTDNGEAVKGNLYKTWLVRFEYINGLLTSPVTLCDTITGSNDHNSGRMIIAPVNGVNYLFYAVGDMGAGQFANDQRINKSQMSSSYEGKILRFNLESDGEAGMDGFIPDDNPFNGAAQSAVWVTGIRNNQGFAYGRVNGTPRLFGSSHGPFSDDEINIFEKAKNYGHPIVIGPNDGNYDGSKAGPAASVLPLITSEADNVTNVIGTTNYRDPIYSFYAAPKGPVTTQWTIQYIYQNNTIPTGQQGAGSTPQNSNGFWASEGIAGMDLYQGSKIPGWKNSLISGTLKGGKMIRQPLNATGSGILLSHPTMVPAVSYDTISLLRSTNRFRDLAIAPDGKTLFVVIDSSSTTSGPTTGTPVISACRGCVQRYTFLGYEALPDGKSTLPDHIDIAQGTPNNCMVANSVTIDADNTNYWVPITDTNSNVIAEIKANGNLLGNVSTSFYVHGGAVRETGWYKSLYLNRNVTITPTVQPSTAVNIRIYLTQAEYAALQSATNSSGQPSGVTGVSNLGIFKNNDPCSNSLTAGMSPVINNFQLTRGNNGYVLQATISSFSTFYIANSTALLSLNLLSFKGNIQNGIAQLKWTTESEDNITGFTIQRSVNGLDFDSVNYVVSKGGHFKTNYEVKDSKLQSLNAPIVYYRLKVNNTSGGFSYSQVVPLSLAGNKGSVSARPNPVNSNATVEINAVSGETVVLTLTDNTGKTVLTRNALVNKGFNTITLNMNSLPAGTYYLKVSGTHISQVTKLQKL